MALKLQPLFGAFEVHDASGVRQVMAGGTVVRWIALALSGIAGIAGHPRFAALLVPWILWVAAYNSGLIWLLPRLRDTGMRVVPPLLLLMDTLSFFVVLLILDGHPPESLFGVAAWILMEGAAYGGARGIAFALTLLLGAFVLLQVGFAFVGTDWLVNVDRLLWPLIMAVTAVCLVMLSKALSRSGLRALPSEAGNVRSPAARPPAVRISTRERQVLLLVARGGSNRMIAERLHLSEHTVNSHIDSLLTRLNARNRAEAVALASQLGLLDEEVGESSERASWR